MLDSVLDDDMWHDRVLPPPDTDTTTPSQRRSRLALLCLGLRLSGCAARSILTGRLEGGRSRDGDQRMLGLPHVLQTLQIKKGKFRNVVSSYFWVICVHKDKQSCRVPWLADFTLQWNLLILSVESGKIFHLKTSKSLWFRALTSSSLFLFW